MAHLQNKRLQTNAHRCIDAVDHEQANAFTEDMTCIHESPPNMAGPENTNRYQLVWRAASGSATFQSFGRSRMAGTVLLLLLQQKGHRPAAPPAARCKLVGSLCQLGCSAQQRQQRHLQATVLLED